MTKKNIAITALAAMLVMAMSAVAFAGYHGSGYGRGGCQNNPAYQQLTPEKQAAVDKIVESYVPKFTELRTEMWTKHATLQAMVNGGNADEKKIGNLTAELTKLRDNMFDLRDKMATDLEKETGITAFGRGGCQTGSRQACGQGRGQGQGRGMMQQTY